MKIFIEKEFIENFEIEFSDNKYSDAWKKLYLLFTEYPNIECYIDTDEENHNEVIDGSEILRKLSDINPRIFPIKGFKEAIVKEWSDQTLVFTAQERDWFKELKDLPVLFFSYDDFEEKLSNFIQKTHKKFDLSDLETKFDWKYFGFISDDNNILFFSDTYVLADKSGQRIKDNLLQLLNKNLNKNKSYKVFILTKFQNVDVDNKFQFLNSELGGYAVKIYLINRIESIENIVFHDRLLYTNYTITESPYGFNLKRNKPVNSEVTTSSIFEKYTYKKYLNHMNRLNEYIQVLEGYADYNNTTKVIPSKTFEEFDKLNLL
jgi:hypothetical protein